MGAENAKAINSAISMLNFEGLREIDVVLAGSIYVKGEHPATIEKIKQDVESANHKVKINLNVLQVPPVRGAVLWAFQEKEKDPVVFERVVASFL